MLAIDFGKRRATPCFDCDADGHCTMNCGPAMTPTHECPICHKKSFLEPGAPPQCAHTDKEWRTHKAEQFQSEDDDEQIICPATGNPCVTEQDEFCGDYGCARKAGIDPDSDLVP